MSIDSRALHYVDNQPNEYQWTLLLIHGAGGSLAVWPPEFFELPDCRVVAIDLPGHGLSSLPGRRLVEQYALVVETFVTAMNLSGVVFVGHSLGSAIALTAAWRRTISLKGLILFGASARMPVGSPLLEGSIHSLNDVASFIADYGLMDAPAGSREEVRQQILNTGSMTTFGDFLACNRFDLRGVLAEMDVPSMIIAGRHDGMTPLRFSESLAASMPNSSLLVFEDCGHFAMLEHTRPVLSAMRNFLDRMAAPRSEV